MASSQQLPDGIADRHARHRRYPAFTAIVPLLVLGAVLALAMTGVLGGAGDRRWSADIPAARMEVAMPMPLRNGMFFEMRVTVDPRRRFDDLTIAVSEPLWHQFTINTQLPAASEETSKNGLLHFSYGAVAAGERLQMKIDGQINPPLMVGNRGEIALYDRDRRISAIPIVIRVLP